MNNLAILVLSCDKFSSLWDVYFDRWNRFWPNCPYPTYLLSNHKDYVRDGVHTIRVGDDRDWTSNLQNALNNIAQEHVLLMIEDAPLAGAVDQAAFAGLFKQYLDKQANYLNMKAAPKPPAMQGALGELPAGMLYRTALVPCIWRKSVLEDLLVTGETAWHFEILGSERSAKFDRFYGTERPFFTWLHYVVKGKVDRKSAKILTASGEIASIQFPVMSRMEHAKFVFQNVRSRCFNAMIPPRHKAAVRAAVYKLLHGSSKVV